MGKKDSMVQQISGAFQKTDLIALNQWLMDPHRHSLVDQILSNFIKQSHSSKGEGIWLPIFVKKLILACAPDDQYHQLLALCLRVIHDPHADMAEGDYPLQVAAENNALQNLKLLAEYQKLQYPNAQTLKTLALDYVDNDQVQLLIKRLQKPSKASLRNKLSFKKTPLYSDQNIFAEEHSKWEQIKSIIAGESSLIGQDQALSGCSMPAWKEAFLLARRYPSLYAASGQVFSVDTTTISRHCSGVHIGKGYFLTAGYYASNIYQALSSLYVSFDYQYDISGKYQQRLDQQYKVKRLVYNGFIAANLINGVTRHDDYLIFKLKKVPQQAVNCTTEIPPLDTELTMIHHPQGMLKKASIGQLTSITDTHENKLTLSSDLQHNIAGWAGSSGAGLYWAQQDRVCAIQLANDHCASHAHNEHSSSKAISLKRISDDITASPLFERNKDVRIVHRLLQGQGLFKSAVKPRSSTGQPESSANRYRLA